MERSGEPMGHAPGRRRRSMGGPLAPSSVAGGPRGTEPPPVPVGGAARERARPSGRRHRSALRRFPAGLQRAAAVERFGQPCFRSSSGRGRGCGRGGHLPLAGAEIGRYIQTPKGAQLAATVTIVPAAPAKLRPALEVAPGTHYELSVVGATEDDVHQALASLPPKASYKLAPSHSADN